jgi:hypothetical protein
MDYVQLLRRLLEIERAIGICDSLSIRKMIIEAEDYVLQSQKEQVEKGRSGKSHPVPRQSYFSLEREVS